MSSLEKQVLAAGYGDRIFTERLLADILDGSDGRRYGLVNRALKDGSLIRVKRGLYILNSARKSIHEFSVAHALHPGSFISFETALSYHGWIPEGVFTTACVTSSRKTLKFEHDRLGLFTFHPLAMNDFEFLKGVTRVKLGLHTAMIATPLRSLMDLVAQRKQSWEGLGWIEHGMRIDEEFFTTLRRKDFAELKGVYKHKAAREFLARFESAVFERKTLLKVVPKVSTGDSR